MSGKANQNYHGISRREISLYQRFLAEREQVLRHKWLESEKAGRDIGWESALIDWVKNHRDRWLNGPDDR